MGIGIMLFILFRERRKLSQQISFPGSVAAQESL